MHLTHTPRKESGWRKIFYEVIFESETPAGKAFDVALIWAIVTMTTVGYGDLSPQTPFGQMLAALVMIVGYGIIAVPTGIVTVEFSHAAKQRVVQTVCPVCGVEGHDPDAAHCKYCGTKLRTDRFNMS